MTDPRALEAEVQYEIDEVTMSPGELFRKWPVVATLRRIADMRRRLVSPVVLRMTQEEAWALMKAVARHGTIGKRPEEVPMPRMTPGERVGTFLGIDVVIEDT